MGTLQSPSPSPYPNRSPVPNANNASNPSPNANTATELKSPSFDEVSKLFTLPLSNAADSLGVCPSVLKKVCYDNGLLRWPYRKFLAGKGIEEIKEDAAKEKKKQLAASTLSGRSDSLASSTISASPAPQPQSTNTGSLQQSPTSRMFTQQPTIDKASTPTSDEFKYGFPSNGLSTVTYRWWGDKSSNESGIDSEKHSAEERKRQPNDTMDTAANLSVSEDKKDERDGDIEWASSLSALRKRAAEEGQQAPKLGVYKRYDVKTLDRTKKMAMFQIFKSDLPSEWGGVSSSLHN